LNFYIVLDLITIFYHFVQSNDNLVVQSNDHLVVQSNDHLVVQSNDHLVVESNDNHNLELNFDHFVDLILMNSCYFVDMIDTSLNSIIIVFFGFFDFVPTC
jgi:hypothetical protein